MCLIALAAGTALPACEGTSGNVQNVLCPDVVADKGLVYPAPGATGIPDAVRSVIVSGPVGQVTLTPPSGAAIVSTTPTAVPSPIPSPNATPANTPVTAFAVPSLAPNTTYTVVAVDTSVTLPCAEALPQTLGTFATQ